MSETEKTYLVRLAFGVTLDTTGGELTGEALLDALAENVEEVLANIIGTEPLASFIESAEPVLTAHCDVCDQMKPRDQVRLVTPAMAGGTETWACAECREGGR